MQIEQDAIETYQATTTLLLSYKLAEKRYPMSQKKNTQGAKARRDSKLKIANSIKYTANQLANQTKDKVLFDTLKSIVRAKDAEKIIETLNLTFNTMKRDGII